MSKEEEVGERRDQEKYGFHYSIVGRESSVYKRKYMCDKHSVYTCFTVVAFSTLSLKVPGQGHVFVDYLPVFDSFS